ncbi:MAG: tetratricopeptide repeat protein [Candidatus Marinimicrobia bacterium]|nr:tetratricopeptide repeat protein [Candidatus Neomarinimicrobiota bacterium]
MRLHIKYLILLILIPLTLFAQEEERERLFVKANSYYSSEQYSLALDLYEEIAETGRISFELYYNMGNCYYRLGQTGQAIRYWEKAKRIRPRDTQVNHNLALARLRITDKMVLPEAFFPIQLWWDLRDMLGASFSFRLSGYFLMSGLILFFISRKLYKKRWLKRLSNPLILLISILFIISLSLSLHTRHYDKTHHFGILLNKEVEVKSAPQEAANTLFMLHEGSKVRILDKAGTDWVEVSYYDDKVGWIKQNQIGDI